MSEPYPIWRQERCDLCKAGVPMSAAARYHFDGNIHDPDDNPMRCAAPTDAEYIAELTSRVAGLERELEQSRESYQHKEPCGHYRNFLIGDEYGNFSCTVCRIAELEKDTARLAMRIKELEMVIRGVPRAEIDAHMNQTAQGEVKPIEVCACRFPDFWGGHKFCGHCGKPGEVTK